MSLKVNDIIERDGRLYYVTDIEPIGTVDTYGNFTRIGTEATALNLGDGEIITHYEVAS